MAILFTELSRCFFMALSYQHASRWLEALALFDRAADQIKTALEHYSTIKNVAVVTMNLYVQFDCEGIS